MGGFLRHGWTKRMGDAPTRGRDSYTRTPMAISRKTSLLTGKSITIWFLIAIYLMITLFPIFFSLLLSFKPKEILFDVPPKFIFRPTLEFWKRIFTEKLEIEAFANSFIIAGVSTIMTLFIGSLAAFAFAFYRFPLRKALFILFFSSRMYFPITTLIPIYLAMSYLRLIDTRTALIINYTGVRLALVVWMMRAFFARLPKSLLESAMLDGCSRIRAFFQILLPLSVSGLAATGMVIFIFNWNEFLMALVLTSRAVRTAPVTVASYYIVELDLEWGLLAIMGLLTLVPAILFTTLCSKYLVKGLTLGAVKG